MGHSTYMPESRPCLHHILSNSLCDTGKPEPVTIGKDGQPAMDVRTITFETRVVEGEEDKVLRRTMHATSARALQAQAATAADLVIICCQKKVFCALW